MRLFGQYFKWSSADRLMSDPHDKVHSAVIALPPNEDTPSPSHTFSKIYAVSVLTMLWFNGIRMLTIFTSDDKSFPVLLQKVMLVVFSNQCAIQQTAYFLACRSGKLDKVLSEARLQSPACGIYFRHKAAMLAACAWSLMVVNVAFFVYIIFFTGGIFDGFLAPFSTHIHITDMSVIKIIFFILCIYIIPAYCLPTVMTFTLSVIYFFQFRFLTTKLRQVISRADGGVTLSDDDIEEIRQQHHTLCHSVERADRFLKVYHFAAFFGPLTCVIILLYNLVVYPSALHGDATLTFINVFWLTGGACQLLLTSAGGIMVNHAVSISMSDFFNDVDYCSLP